jgi:hypothetical protein
MTSDQMLEFTVPFDLDSCRQRLDNRHERPKLFAWDWSRRTYVHTRQTAPDTVNFTLKRLEKNEWVSWGSLGVVRGDAGVRSRADGGHHSNADRVSLDFCALVFILIALAGLWFVASNDPDASAAI